MCWRYFPEPEHGRNSLNISEIKNIFIRAEEWGSDHSQSRHSWRSSDWHRCSPPWWWTLGTAGGGGGSWRRWWGGHGAACGCGQAVLGGRGVGRSWWLWVGGCQSWRWWRCCRGRRPSAWGSTADPSHPTPRLLSGNSQTAQTIYWSRFDPLSENYQISDHE